MLEGIEDLEARESEREELHSELVPAMERRGHDSAPIRQMDGRLGFRQWTAGLSVGRINPQEGCFPCWRYPDHARRKSPG